MNTEEETLTNWAIYIDIEGFSQNYKIGGIQRGQMFEGLRSLMEGIHGIGANFCIGRERRLCAYQAGDGFFIDSGYGSPDVPIAIAVILMRSALLAGALTSAGISEGDCVDIRSLRPDAIKASAKGDDVPLGETGHLRLFPVMGTAYIRAHEVTKNRGCLLAINSEMMKRSSVESIPAPEVGNVIDWIHADFPEIHRIADAAAISIGDRGTLESELERLAREATFTSPKSREEWLANTLKFNHCE